MNKKKSSLVCLDKCFLALVDQKVVNLDLEVLKVMLRKELNINLDSLEPELASILPFTLVYYIKYWPGWAKRDEYHLGQISFNSWYEKFRNFITIKLNETIDVHFKEAMKELRMEKAIESENRYKTGKKADQSSLTELTSTCFAPFTIDIEGTPDLLNTIVFCGTLEGDILLKKYNTLEGNPTLFDSLSANQLMAWPHVGISVTSPIFSFSRRNVPGYQRFISLVGMPLRKVTTDFIEEIKLVDPQKPQLVYTLRYLKQIMGKYYQEYAKMCSSRSMLKILRSAIDAFLRDIEEMNITKDGNATMASNTCIRFNISKQTYYRNKKIAKGLTTADVSYNEFVVPKMEVSFTALANQHDTNEYLRKMENYNPHDRSIQFSPPQIKFSCTFCNQNFDAVNQLVNHLKDSHKMEQSLLCANCKRPLSVTYLSSVRWHHYCNPT